MRKKIKNIIKILLLVFVILWNIYYIVSFRNLPIVPEYGVSFNTLYARELGLNWKEVYDSIIDDLGVKKIRLAAHWDMIEPEEGKFNFEEIDYQVKKASDNNVEIILAVGKRLPRWPECHIPDWAQNLEKEDLEPRILKYIEVVVNRYKNNSNIKVWQVENEPFLGLFAKDHCKYFDRDFLDEEIQLVRDIDLTRKILVTDSGELSTWRNAYKRGDVFGNTLYVYAWNEWMGEFRNFVLPGFYSAKRNIWNVIYGKKETIIAELSLEPWLDKPVVKEKMSVQIERMSQSKFENVLKFANETGFETQFLWGAEWWYYMKLQGYPWYWDRGTEIFGGEIFPQ